jgi:hypothetical protein
MPKTAQSTAQTVDLPSPQVATLGLPWRLSVVRATLTALHWRTNAGTGVGRLLQRRAAARQPVDW